MATLMKTPDLQAFLPESSQFKKKYFSGYFFRNVLAVFTMTWSDVRTAVIVYILQTTCILILHKSILKKSIHIVSESPYCKRKQYIYISKINKINNTCHTK